MEAIAGIKGPSDAARYDAKNAVNIYNMAEENGKMYHIPKDDVFNDSPNASTDQQLLAMSHIYKTDLFRPDQRGSLPSRERVIKLDAQNSGAWGRTILIKDVAMQTFKMNHFIDVNISQVNTNEITLPTLSAHISNLSKSEVVFKIYDGTLQDNTDNIFPAKNVHQTGVSADTILTYSAFLYMRIAMTKNGIEVSANTKHKDKVRMARYAGFKAAKRVTTIYNNTHSKVEIQRNAQMLGFSHWDQNQLDNFDRDYCGNKKIEIYTTRPFISPNGVDGGDTWLGEFKKLGATNVWSKFTDTVNLISKSSKMDKLIRPENGVRCIQEEFGIVTPKEKHTNITIGIPICDVINRDSRQTEASGSYGMTVRSVNIQLEDKDKMFYLAPSDAKIMVNTQIICFYDGGNTQQVKFNYTHYFPIVCKESKIEGGNVTSVTLINKYIELQNALNQNLMETTTIDDAEIFRQNSQSAFPTNSSFTMSIGSQGLVTQSMTLLARQQWYPDDAIYDADGWFNYGIVVVVPNTETTISMIPHGTIPQAYDKTKIMTLYTAGKVPANAIKADTSSNMTEAVASILNPLRLSCINIVDIYTGYKIIAQPAVQSLSLSMATTNFIETIEGHNLQRLNLWQPTSTNKFAINKYTVNITPHGHDIKGMKGGINASRLPSTPVIFNWTDFAQQDKTKQITLDHIHLTENYTITTANAKYHAVS